MQYRTISNLATNVRQFCKAHHLRLNTDLGQHFLIDQDVLDAIIEAGSIQHDDVIIEIGPGIGVLTKELLAHCNNVTAIEIDERMLPILHTYTAQQDLENDTKDTLTSNDQRLTIINQNALHTDMPKAPYKVIANIPYHITSPLLRHIFMESSTAPTSLTLLIQKEVAERICDTKNASMLSILVKLFGTPHIVCTVPPDSFLPPPKVDSAVIHIDCFEKPITNTQTLNEVFRLTKIAFSQKRKKLRNTLGGFPEIMERLSALGIDENRRPQELSIDEWIALAQKN